MTFNVSWSEYPNNLILTTNKGNKWIRYPFHHKRLFKANPEELVRLQCIQFLVNEMDIPIINGAIEVEVKMSDFDKSDKGRADIVVYAQDEEGYFVPILIVECKANNIPLTEDVLNQVERYDEILGANTVMVTNGKLLRLYSWDTEHKKYIGLNEIPTYEELVKKAKLYPIKDKGWRFF
jgi:hypothetical protein